MPLSQTSIRTLSPARRQPSRILPRSVYRTAFESRLRNIVSSIPLSLRTTSSGTDQAPPQPLVSNGIEEIGRQGIKYFIDREVALRRTQIPGLQAIDVEQARQNAGHGVEGSRYSADKVASLAIREVRPKCRLQESQRLQRLSQVMAGGRQEAGFCLICQCRRFPGAGNLLFKSLPLRDVGRQPIDAYGLPAQSPKCVTGNLLQPHFAAPIRPQKSERHRM